MSDYTKLDPYAKRLWINALRSGDYAQNTDGFFYHTPTGTYCAAGVFLKALRLQAPFALEYPWEALESRGMPVEVINDLNDIQKLSFAEIADWIEENL